MTEQEIAVLKELPNVSYGKVMLKYLGEERERLGDITTATEADLRGRQFVVDFIKKFERTLNLEKPKVGKNDYQ
jgi:hypothetical protein